MKKAGLIERLEKPLRGALAAASLAKGDIADVILMGGSTHIPFIREWLAGYFAIDESKVLQDSNFDELVARGATKGAALLTNQLDVLPSTLGI